MRGIVCALLLFYLSSCQRMAVTSKAAITSIRSSYPNVCIDSSYQRIGPCEPSIALNPANPEELVVGSVLDNVYRSSDGGVSWKAEKLESEFGVFGDPVLVSNNLGHFFYVHLSDPTGRGRNHPAWLDRITVQRSSDSGANWIDAGFAGWNQNKDQDKPWMAIDPISNYLFLTWTEFDSYGSSDPAQKSRVLFSKSIDGGEHWSRPIRISDEEGNCLDGDLTPVGAVPAVGVFGEIYVSWAYNDKIWLDVSLDGGQAWLAQDRVLADQLGGWSFDIPGLKRANGMPNLAVDLSSGPNRGNIYLNWADQRNGPNDTDIWFSRSTDLGSTWSPALRVNDDLPGKHQFFSSMCVDPVSGYIYIVYYDRRNFTDTNTDVYLAYSKDGGQSFHNELISEKPFSPRIGNFFGDYNGIVAYNGRVRPVWTRGEGLKRSIWTALIEINE